jgi:hypothetical protein
MRSAFNLYTMIAIKVHRERKLNMKYKLFESVEQMLAPESNPRKIRYVLKRLSRSFDWMMVAGEDHVCRSVTLWQSGLLDQLRPDIDHTILACARDGDGWAILMQDISKALVEAPNYPSDQVYIAIEALAALHATFWEHPALDDPSIGLGNISSMLQTFSPDTARRYQNVYGLPDWWSDWIIDNQALLLKKVAPDIAHALGELQDDLQPLLKALGLEPYTLLHGDYGGHNLGLNSNGKSKIYLFDWSLTGYGLPTVDLGWFVDGVVSRSDLLPGTAVDYYRQCLERRLGRRFPDADWQRWEELGRLAHILRLGFVMAWGSQNWEIEEERPIFQRVVAGYSDQIRAGLKWL